jgi:hypothetical protein
VPPLEQLVNDFPMMLAHYQTKRPPWFQHFYFIPLIVFFAWLYEDFIETKTLRRGPWGVPSPPTLLSNKSQQFKLLIIVVSSTILLPTLNVLIDAVIFWTAAYYPAFKIIGDIGYGLLWLCVYLIVVLSWGLFCYRILSPRMSSQLQSSNNHSVSAAQTPTEPQMNPPLPDHGRDPTDIKPLSDTIYGFRGNYFILAFLGFFTIFPILAFFVVYDAGLLFSAILFGAGTFAYWKWFQTPRTIVSATKPPDVAPLAKPISGNMRIDIQRREVVRRQKTVGLSSVTFNTFELIIEVQFSETALNMIHHANLTPYVLSKHTASMFDFTFEHEYDPPIVVRDLIGKPLVVIRDALPELNAMENELRAALNTLNEAIKTAGGTPAASRDTFEL